MLSGCCGSERELTRIFDRSYFVVARKGNVEKFKNLLGQIVDLFDLESTRFNWNNIQIIGIIKDVMGIVERLGE